MRISAVTGMPVVRFSSERTGGGLSMDVAVTALTQLLKPAGVLPDHVVLDRSPRRPSITLVMPSDEALAEAKALISKDSRYAKVSPLSFPVDNDGHGVPVSPVTDSFLGYPVSFSRLRGQ